MKIRLSIVAAALACTAAVAAPKTIVLPAETAALKPSPHPGYAIAQQKCGICHSADYVDYQPPSMTLAQWTAETRKMKAMYGAPLDDGEIALVAAYLTTSYGDARTVEVATAAAAPALPTQAPKGKDAASLLADNGCLACHASDRTIVGPAYHDVAQRYRADPTATATLPAHIRDGGSGRWGTVPMPPFPQLSSDDVATLSGYVLAQ